MPNVSSPLLREKGTKEAGVLYPSSDPKDTTAVFSVRKGTTPKYPVSMHDYGRYLHSTVSERKRLRGLILITGETGCGKTRYLNAMLYHILKGVNHDQAKWPHLVSIGDPVETWLYPDMATGEPLPRGFDSYVDMLSRNPGLPLRFTPRTLGVDVESVEAATNDALRETPIAFIVGELRQDEDFRAALKFAGTGHLVLATAHATSLVDAMTRLIRVERAESASDRFTISQRLAMLCYLSPLLSLGPEKQVTLPKLWRNNAAGARSFVAEGLSSLGVPGPLGSRDSGMLSYSCALEELLKYDSELTTRISDVATGKARREADRLDLRGL